MKPTNDRENFRRRKPVNENIYDIAMDFACLLKFRYGIEDLQIMLKKHPMQREQIMSELQQYVNPFVFIRVEKFSTCDLRKYPYYFPRT